MTARARVVGVRRLALAGAAVVTLGLAACTTGDSPTSVAEQRREVAAQLAKASAAQGVCYGWLLEAGYGGTPPVRGSNLGETVPVDSDPQRCPSWVEIRATVRYVSESSELEDSASFDVLTSSNLTVGPSIQTNLGRFGVDEQVFIDDPDWAIARAALALPLLTTEAGGADPAPTPSTPTTATPRALADPGSDFWRDRWVFVLVAIGLGLFAILFATVGIVSARRLRLRRQQRRLARR
jgi:hypothetical protein